jgi:hypothetical protein
MLNNPASVKAGFSLSKYLFHLRNIGQMARNTLSAEVFKRPHAKTDYSDEDMADLAKCMDDPLFFMRNFVRVQHPMKGALPFIPYECQERIITGIHDHRFTIILTARQQGKCVRFTTKINENGIQTDIGSLLRVSWREKLINLLERCSILVSLW